MTSKILLLGPAALLVIAGCAMEKSDAHPPAPPPATPSSSISKHQQHCDTDGNCRLHLESMDSAKAVCDGDSPTLYWKSGSSNSLLACECHCTSHDNFGWFVHATSGHVQGISLGKAATFASIRNSSTVDDIMSSHEFCDTSGHESDKGEFVSLIKYPTGNDESPYCFSVRLISESNGSITAREDGRPIAPEDTEVFLDTPADVKSKIREIVRAARDED